MRILLFDSTQYEPASPLFLDALKASGHEFQFFDEAPFAALRSVVHKAGYHLLRRRPLSYWSLNRKLIENAVKFRPRVMVVVKGAYIAPHTLFEIKRRTGAFLANYATDDPFNPVNATPDLTGSIALYDLYACPRRAVLPDLRRAGCARSVYLPFAYKPGVHFAETPAGAEERRRFQSDVVFVGGADRDRIPLFEALSSVPGLALYGGYWRQHASLRRFARGFATGRDYRLALGGAKIAIGLVRRANRDGHSMRTFEIPACGAFFLAERTEEHQELFEEGTDAQFFGSEAELLDKARYYLRHDAERQCIARAGFRRVTAGGHTWQSRFSQLLQAVNS